VGTGAKAQQRQRPAPGEHAWVRGPLRARMAASSGSSPLTRPGTSRPCTAGSPTTGARVTSGGYVIKGWMIIHRPEGDIVAVEGEALCRPRTHRRGRPSGDQGHRVQPRHGVRPDDGRRVQEPRGGGGGRVTASPINRAELAERRTRPVQPWGTRAFCPRPPLRRVQLATMAMPKGVAPIGSVVGDDASSIREPPLTAKPLTDAIAASTTYR
jgi:hypothetical protein